jgi:hypothetical protein
MAYDNSSYNDWYLFLDDVRNVDDVYPDLNHDWYKVARTTEEAKALVGEFGVPLFMSLDHDLGAEDTSLEFLKWLANERTINWNEDVPDYKVHSANPVGAKNIISFMDSWYSAWQEEVDGWRL